MRTSPRSIAKLGNYARGLGSIPRRSLRLLIRAGESAATSVRLTTASELNELRFLSLLRSSHSLLNKLSLRPAGGNALSSSLHVMLGRDAALCNTLRVLSTGIPSFATVTIPILDSRRFRAVDTLVLNV